MRGIHVNSTLPSVPYLGRLKGPDGYQVEDFELLTTVLSAAAWRRFNGPISLYTDRVGEAYYRRLGMTELWDGGIDTDVLESLPASISHDVFWTAGRVAAIRAADDVFVAQRLLPMCALRLGIRPTYFLDWPRPQRNSETMVGGGKNQLFTHVWAYKDALEADPDRREAFYRQAVARIRADYPELMAMLRHMPTIERYLR